MLLSLDESIPMCSVSSVLTSKGMRSRKLEVFLLLVLTVNTFLDKYMTKFVDQFPKVLET